MVVWGVQFLFLFFLTLGPVALPAVYLRSTLYFNIPGRSAPVLGFLTLTLHTPGCGRRNPLRPLPPLSVCRPLAVDHCILGWEPEGLKGPQSSLVGAKNTPGVWGSSQWNLLGGRSLGIRELAPPQSPPWGTRLAPDKDRNAKIAWESYSKPAVVCAWFCLFHASSR